MTSQSTVAALGQLTQLAERRRREQRKIGALWAMTRADRLAAMREGRLSLAQLRVWTAAFPDEVLATSLTGTGELYWILCQTPEYLGDD
ncbi:hypothetical protein FSW04_14050 [Baekduia soli]|uniref:Uncharacterized protein n=1 Tax=Baekduia soli TaxID=496014 RepID=A0A5B8U7C9_9ACTN|nr:hypothetical protein [Baekduia soli]QEC48582.1 hypothetical protein FSW04_14050 [Baekduia soli]